MTALDLAEVNNILEIFKLLLADNRTGNHINHYSYISTFKTCGVKDRFNFCKRIFDIEVIIGHSVTQSESDIQFLLLCNVLDVNTVDSDGNSVLQRAVQSDKDQYVAELLKQSSKS